VKDGSDTAAILCTAAHDAERRLRILVLTPDYPPRKGGIQTLTAKLVEHAERLRCRVVTLGSPGASEFDESHGADVRRSGRSDHWRRASIGVLNVRAAVEATRFRPQAVLSMHIVTSPAAWLIGRGLRVPVVQYLHAREIGARPALTRFAVRYADATIAVSDYTRSLALSAASDPSNIHIIPPGVELPAGRREHRSSAPTVLTVARLEARDKGHDVLVEAMPMVRERVADLRWVVVGEGSLRPELQLRVEQRGLAHYVEFTGAVSDAERDAWLDRAWLFALPSRGADDVAAGEGFGIVYLEASAHGLPVVAGDSGGALDAVVHGETGILVDPTDSAAVADAISGLLLDRQRADALGEAGAEWARKFAWPAIAQRVEDALVGLARPSR
jgi:phosphatidylinositol alpha-1,6-mannosyltransferase